MAKKLDSILVIDLEATCWEGSPPPGQESEIIEIGACLLDVTSGERSHKQSILVRPERSTVSPFCTRLTTLTQEQVEGGLPFTEAVEKLRREYAPTNRAWASYGDYDRVKMQQQCEECSIKYPFNRTHINVKNLFALGMGLRGEVGLDEALALLGMPMEGTHHRGHDDAWNIAGILSVLLMRIRAGGK